MKDYVKVAVMGATGTGKSALIHHLTNDSEIRVSHSIESKTSEIQTSSYIDTETGRSIMLIDTPGFDDSRPGITDVDILQRILDFLEPEKGERKKLNGIIYMHRISDPRLGGIAIKNIRMFEAMCGKKGLPNVCLVTTYWDHEDGRGPAREDELKEGPFKSLLTSGARMYRHQNTRESARAIMAELIPLPEVTTQIQEEVAKDIPLGETSAGRVLNERIEEFKKKNEEELAVVRKLLEQAVRNELRADLEAERTVIEEKITRAEEDQRRLSFPLQKLREQKRDFPRALMQLPETAARTTELGGVQRARGGSRKFFRNWGSVTVECAVKVKDVFEVVGTASGALIGVAVGAVIGLCIVGPVVAVKRAVFDR